MPVGSSPCFPCVQGVGRQLKVQTETHSLILCMARAQRLRGLSALQQQGLLTVRNLPRRKDDSVCSLNCNSCSYYRYGFSAKQSG